jgi:hypothetical protein
MGLGVIFATPFLLRATDSHSGPRPALTIICSTNLGKTGVGQFSDLGLGNIPSHEQLKLGYLEKDNMARSGDTPQDFRSEGERIGARPGSPDFNTEYHRGGRAPGKVEIKRASRFEAAENARDLQRKVSSDQVIRQKVLDALAMESSDSYLDITVDVEDGIVLLEGSVDTINTKYRATEVAKRFAGVTEVDNCLKIRVGEALDEFTRGIDTVHSKNQTKRETPE